MIKIINITSLILLISIEHVASGQTTFNYQEDFNKVLAQTKDNSGDLSYDKLMTRFAVNDTTLSDFEVLALLIGFTDKPEFKPYSDLRIERKIYAINGEGKYKEALDSANVFLQTHPLSVKVLFEKGYAFHKLGQEDSASFYTYKGHRIFQAMYFSGEGTTLDTPSFALGPADGQDYIRKFVRADIGTMGSGQDKNGNFLDILEAKFEDGASMNLYFIIQHATEKMFSPEDKIRMEAISKEIVPNDKKTEKKKKGK